MKYKLFNNSHTGMHCVQACLQMLLYSMSKPVLSLQELDAITVHDPHKFTWMNDALVWLALQGIKGEFAEDFDYHKFIEEGESYLKTLWDERTFNTQKEFSDFEYERKSSQRMIDAGIRQIPTRPTIDLLRQKYTEGYFVMASVNQFILEGRSEYGSHMVVISNINDNGVTIFDPDKVDPYDVSMDIFYRACIDKSDAQVLFFKPTKE